MRYLSLFIAIIIFSCASDSTQDAETTDSQQDAVALSDDSESEAPTEVIEEVAVKNEVIVTEKEVVVANTASDNTAVKSTFLSMVEAINDATGDNASQALNFLDKDYVFKGRDKTAAGKRFAQQFASFKNEITDVKVMQLESSGNLAYLIASFKRSMIDRASGEVKVNALDKVGLFVMRKDSAGAWKLLVQKTDRGFAHWYYMPEE